jgi:hypothetical protein
MKCSICRHELESTGMVLTLVNSTAAHTATVHAHCLDGLIGTANARKLRTLAFESGWEQLGLVGFGNLTPRA